MRAIQRSDRPLLSATSAVLFFVFSCVLSTARILYRAPVPSRLEADHVAQRSDQRFAAIKLALPDRGVIGYIGAGDPDGTADYYLAQYALAPRVIDRSSSHPLVVGNFSQGPPKILPPGLTVVKDFGKGVLLFSNKDGR
jgi:hypothetical protein